MSRPLTADATAGDLVRLRVRSGSRAVDLAVPGSVAVAEVVPGLARNLGVLDPTTVHAGWVLVRSDGAALTSHLTLRDQGVEDGAVLTLDSAAETDVRVYDDVVEAVADAVEADSAPWTPQDSSVTAVAVAVAFLLTGGLLLLGSDDTSGLPPLVAAAGAVLALVAGAVVGRVGTEHAARHGSAAALAVAGVALAGVAGATAVPGPPSWGLPALAGGLAALVATVAAAPVLPDRREVLVAPLTLASAVAAVGAVVAGTGTSAGVALAMTTAVVVTAGNAVPWLALGATPLRAVPLQTPADVLADPEPIDPEAVRAAYLRGRRFQVALRAAVGLLALAAAPAVIGTGLPGVLLLVAGFSGMLLGVRQSHSRLDVAVVMGTGVVGLALTGALVAALHPAWRPALAVTAGAVAAAVVVLALLSARQRPALSRLADVAEVLALTLLLPLGVAAAGLV